MKKLLFVILFLPMLTEGQSWQWARSSTGRTANAWPIAVDSKGAVLTCGIYWDLGDSSITFGHHIVPDTGVITGDKGQVVIAKYDTWGNVAWARGTQRGDAYPIGITTDKNDNVYVFGAFESDSLQLGQFVLLNKLPNNPSYNFQYFVAKYDKDGNTLWAKTDGNAPLWLNAAESNLAAGIFSYGGIAADSSGNVYLTTAYTLPVTTAGTFTLTNTGSSNVLMAKYDSSGNVLWAKKIGGTGYDMPYALTLSPDGTAVYITGVSSSSSLAFGSTVIANPSPGSSVIFIARLDSSGNVQWAKRTGRGNEYASGLATDAAGDIYVTGSFNDTTLAFGSMNIVSPHPGYGCSFLIKFDHANNPLWYKTAYGDSYITGYSVATDMSGNVWMSGSFGNNIIPPVYWFSQIVHIDTDSLYNPEVGNSFFIAHYNSSGNLIGDSVVALGSGAQDGIACDAQGNLYLLNNTAIYPVIASPNDTISEFSVVLLKYGYPPLNISQIMENDQVNIYPNPATKQLTIRLTNQVLNQVVIMNLLGQTVYAHEYENTSVSSRTGPVQVNVSDLVAGVYFVRINGVVVRKFVKL